MHFVHYLYIFESGYEPFSIEDRAQEYALCYWFRLS